MTTTIIWRPEENAMTTPHTWWARHIPRATFGNEEVAARIALRNPVYSEGLCKGVLEELAAELLDALVKRRNDFIVHSLKKIREPNK